jgi:hypothetical protein
LIWKIKGLQAIEYSCNPLVYLEAATGFEPVNNGFAVAMKFNIFNDLAPFTLQNVSFFALL